MSSSEENKNTNDALTATSSSTPIVPTANTTDAAATTSTKKVKVHFVPVGSAPMMKKTKFQLGSDQRFASVQSRLRSMLKLQAGDSLFLYLTSSFCPGPDQLMGDLEDLFATRGELIVHYSVQEAWG